MLKRNRITLKLKNALLVVGASLVLLPLTQGTVFAACGNYGGINGVLGIPPWYKYLGDDGSTSALAGRCVPKVGSVTDVIPIVLAVIEIMLRIATYVAIAMFIYGAIRMIISQGTPDEIRKSRDTVVNAVIGLVIALIATAIVNFVGRTLG